VPALPALVRELLAERARLRAQNADLQGQLDQALKHRCGRRSERRRGRPRRRAEDQPTPRRDEHGHAPVPAHLERRAGVPDLTEAEQLCPCCGQPRVCLGTQPAEHLDLEPARFFGCRTVKKSYACRHGDPAAVPAQQRLQTAGPQHVGPRAKGLCGPGLRAHVRTATFAEHTPLHRLAGQLGRSGVTGARSTLGDGRAAALLDPRYQLMHQRLLRSRVLHGDDTAVKVRVPGAERTRKAHLGAAIGDADYPYVVFDFTADSPAAGPTAFGAGDRGYLQADALAQYEGRYGADGVPHVCCWAPARRKFVVAAEGGAARADVALERLRQLYALARDLPLLLPPAEEPGHRQRRRQRQAQRRHLRQRQAEPILAELKQGLDEQRPRALPRSALGWALGDALNHGAARSR
jgi:transposase